MLVALLVIASIGLLVLLAAFTVLAEIRDTLHEIARWRDGRW